MSHPESLPNDHHGETTLLALMETLTSKPWSTASEPTPYCRSWKKSLSARLQRWSHLPIVHAYIGARFMLVLLLDVIAIHHYFVLRSLHAPDIEHHVSLEFGFSGTVLNNSFWTINASIAFRDGLHVWSPRVWLEMVRLFEKLRYKWYKVKPIILLDRMSLSQENASETFSKY